MLFTSNASSDGREREREKEKYCRCKGCFHRETENKTGKNKIKSQNHHWERERGFLQVFSLSLFLKAQTKQTQKMDRHSFSPSSSCAFVRFVHFCSFFSAFFLRFFHV